MFVTCLPFKNSLFKDCYYYFSILCWQNNAFNMKLYYRIGFYKTDIYANKKKFKYYTKY